MPTCQKCDRQWSWRQTMRTFFSLDSGGTCPYCAELQYPTADSKRRFAYFSFFLLLSILLNLFDIKGVYVLGALFGSAALLWCLYPFIIELTNEEEMPW